MTYSIIQKSQLEGALRLDAEYYCVSFSMKIKSLSGRDVTSLIQYGTSQDLNESNKGYPVLRLNEFQGYFAGIPAKYCDKISNKVFESLKLQQNDVLICRTNGNPKLVGKAAMVMEDTDAAFASYLFRVRPNNYISSPCLTIFLNSLIGRQQIEKYLMPSIQSNFSPAKFREIKIPLFNLDFQKYINELFLSSYLLYKRSQTFYRQAENLLLEELGLKDFDEGNDLFSVVKLSEVQKANRIDAEYFQEKYNELQLIIKDKSQNLTKALEVVPAQFNPHLQPEKKFKYTELADINSSIGTIENGTEILGKEAPSRAKRLLKTNDVIVSSIEGSLEKVALVSENQKDYLASTGFYQFRSKKILPEVLLVSAKSIVLQWQFKQNCAGTILTAVLQESLNQMIIPILPQQTQQKIAELVRQSHSARQKSKELLAEAKSKVEEMIEKGGE